MDIAERTRDRLVIHQSPWRNGGLGLLLLGVGLGVLVLSGGHLFAFLVGGAFAAIGAHILISADDRWIVFDRRARTVVMTVRDRRTSARTEYPFDQISDIALERHVSRSRSSPVSDYRAVFVLTDGERIPWTSESTDDGVGRARCVAAAREFGGWAGGPRAFPTAPIDQLAAWTPRRAARFTGVFFLLISAVALAEAAAVGYRIHTWRPVPATVIQGMIEAPYQTSPRSVRGYTPRVLFQYTVDGVQYLGYHVTPLEGSLEFGSSLAWARRIASRYPTGAAVTAYVSPRNPRDAFLSRDAVPVAWLLYLGLSIPALLFLANWSQSRRSARVAALQPVPVFTEEDRVLRP